MERCQAHDGPDVHPTPFLCPGSQSITNVGSEAYSIALTNLLMNLGNVHRIGMNHSVRDKLPKLPARNVKASHCTSQSALWVMRNCMGMITLSGSARLKIVTSGMYKMAITDPPIQVLKYKLRNQSCCTEPELTRKSQKQSSSKCVTLCRIREY